jgi:hypothetical protein
MSLTKLTDNLNIIQSLADKPTETASELKEAFDTAGNAIKNYINATLTDEIDSALTGVDSALDTKASASSVYSKTDMNALLADKVDSSDVYVKDDFAILTGNFSVTGTTTEVSGRAEISYPSGFNASNCVAIACECTHINGSMYISNSPYFYVEKSFLSLFAHYKQPTTQSESHTYFISYKIVLLKI